MFRKRTYSLGNNPGAGKFTEYISNNSNVELFDDSENDKKCSINCKPLLGLFYTSMTSIFLISSSVIVMQLSYIDPGQLCQIRNTAVWLGCLPIAVFSVKNVFGDKGDRLFLIARGLVGSTAMYLGLLAYRYLPFTEAAVVLSSAPAITIIMARVFLKEQCGIVQIFALISTICGVLLSLHLPERLKNISSDEFDSNYIFGLACAVGCVLAYSVTFVVLRKMKQVHFSVTLLYTGFIGMLENGIINLTISYYVMPQCGWDQAKVILIGVFGFLAHCTLTLAIQAETAGFVSIMKASIDIVVSMMFQIIFFQSNPDVFNITGAFLVMVSVSIIGLSKWVITLPEDSRARKTFRYILL